AADAEVAVAAFGGDVAAAHGGDQVVDGAAEVVAADDPVGRFRQADAVGARVHVGVLPVEGPLPDLTRQIQLAPAPGAHRRRAHGREARRVSRVVRTVDRVLVHRSGGGRAPRILSLLAASGGGVLPFRLAGQEATVPDAER